MITLQELSNINYERALEWHPKGLGDWSISDWACAMAGEAGRVCNAVKKLRRIEDNLQQASGVTEEGMRDQIAQKIGDTYLYLDLLAQRIGISLEEAVVSTFNRVSEREGFTQRL